MSYRWFPAALETATLFGLTPEQVESVADNPEAVGPDPGNPQRDYVVERRRRGDVTAIIGLRGEEPMILGVYFHLPLEERGGSRAPGGAGSDVPTSMRELKRRILRAGLRIEPGGKHDRVVTEDGRFVAALPLTPSDHRSIPNVWKNLARKGYPV